VGPSGVPSAPPTPAPTASTQEAPATPIDATAEHLAILAGTVTYLQRIALTPEAEVQVELRDTPGDATAPPIAKQVIQRPGQVPVAFTLEYDPAAIVPARRYAVSARIWDRGQLQFVTDAPVAVLGGAPPGAVEIVVVPVR